MNNINTLDIREATKQLEDAYAALDVVNQLDTKYDYYLSTKKALRSLIKELENRIDALECEEINKRNKNYRQEQLDTLSKVAGPFGHLSEN